MKVDVIKVLGFGFCIVDLYTGFGFCTVVISKSVNKEGSRCNHTHILGVA